MAAEPLGELDVLISGDYSSLQDAITEAQGVAEQGASSIADAFDVADVGQSMSDSITAVGQAAVDAGDQMSLFGSDASTAAGDVASAIDQIDPATLDTATEAFSGVSDAAQSTVSPVQDAGDAIQETGSNAEEAEGGLTGMAEQLTAIGEALVITEGLKEFGQEALSAASTVQSVTVGLTALTGSATEADAIIEDIKNLAATQPFAFPDIAPTVQKMVAMGVAASAIPGVLQSIADTAAATTNSFDAVANMFDRMTISGVANARSLATLGISAEALNTAMGSLGAGADATTKQISAAFAALPDQATRVTVLEAALSKFAGTSIAEAQTIGGQWQIFQNQFEEVMVSVGDALTPVVSELLSFGEVILSAVGGAVKEFNDLPEPVKEVTVAFGLLTASLVPITGALAAMAFAANGLTTLQGLATALGNSFSGATKEVTVADTAVTEFTELSGPLANVAQVVGVTEQSIDELGKTSLETAAQVSEVAEGASKAAEGIKGLGTAEGVEAAVATTSAEAHTTAADAFLAETAASTEGAAAQELLATATTATTATTVAGGAAAAEAATAIGRVGTVAVVAEGAVALLGIAIAAVDFKTLYDDSKELIPEIEDLGSVIRDGTGYMRDLSSVSTIVSTALGVVTGDAISTGDAAKVLSATVTATGQAFSNDLKTGLMDVIPGLGEVDNAIGLLSKTLPTITDFLSELTGAWGKLPAPIQAAISKFEDANLAQTRLAAGTTTYATGVDAVVAAVNKQNAAASEAQTAYNALVVAMETGQTTAKGEVITQQMVDLALKNVVTTLAATTEAIKTHTTATGAMKDSYDAINKDATALIATENAAQATFDRLSASQDGSIQKAIALGIAQANLEKAITAVSNAVGIEGTAENAIALATQAIYDKTTLANTALTTAQQVYHDVAVETNNGATNQAAYNLAVDALVKAYQAANPALVSAKGNIQDISAAAIDAANKATGLATAHQNMVTIIKNGETTMVAVPAYLNAIGTAATNAVGPLTNFGAAHGNMVTTVAGGHAPLLAAGTDISNLGKYATDAQTPVANLGTGVSHIVQIVGEGGGNSALQTVAETFGTMGTKAAGSVTPISDLGIKVDGLGVIVQDAEGKMQIFPQAIQNIGQAALNTGTDFSNSGDYIADWAVKAGLAKDTTDIFDTSMIKISGDTTSASDAMNQYGTTIVNADGTITNLTDLLKSLATQWENVATATNDATTAQNSYNSAASSAPSGGAGGKSGGGKNEFLTYNNPTTPQGAAAQQLLAGEAGPFAPIQTFNPNETGSPPGQGGTTPGPGGVGLLGGFGPQAVKGPSLTGDNYPPVYGAGSGVAGTPMVLVSNDGGSTWTDAGYGDYPQASGSQFVTAPNVSQQQEAYQQSFAPGGTNYNNPNPNAPATSTTPNQFGATSNTPVYMTDEAGNTWVSNDGGVNWTKAGPGTAPLTGVPVAFDTATASTTSKLTDLSGTTGLASDAAGSLTNALNTLYGTIQQNVSPLQALANATGQSLLALLEQSQFAGTSPAGPGSVSNTPIAPGQQPTVSTTNPNVPTSANPETGVTGSQKYTWDPTSQTWVPTGQTYAGTTNTPGGGGLPAQGASQIDEAAVLAAAGATNIAFTAAGSVIFSAATSAIAAAVQMALTQYELAGAAGGSGAGIVPITAANYGPQAPATLTSAQILALQQQYAGFNISAGGSTNQLDAILATLEETQTTLDAIVSPTVAQTAELTAVKNQIAQIQADLAPIASTPQTPATLTQAQLQALLTDPGLGSGAALPQAQPGGPVNFNLNFSGANIYGAQGAQQFGTALVNMLRSANNQLKFV